ncbi:hypothetical protein N7499_003390 [Penicillium canescens]|uniref:Rhodopsin domain-containing protein n=1 Tax=Penicillium canescens TaxID=5083 RepID=A0AAD6I9G1_PENCN|nr:uncharacterized protein N7446_012317 [Penicillium canescens]KAJ6020098.1 hypothetical protein N7522_000173 [Penicillium canescens]KAJ6038038.1 hypothetical protein N7460_007809 [Penicillium canescens]KAJ6045453.1 hypothetical protein N7446_012317 [Penicillium canescens]KAJ6061131.1 hypothetical protein N7444_001827 [Penicillium canescens]KAJ6090676.1 hypothetical protein N7499_003390 [Penicillium canescens]
MVSTTADDNKNAGTGVLATAWAFTAAAIVVMALRVVAKIKIANFNVDDVVMIIALVFLIASAACVTVAVQVSLARNSTITQEQEVQRIQWYLAAPSACIISCATGRIAFIMYLRRLVPLQSKTRTVFWLLLGLQPPVNIVPILLMYLQCKGAFNAATDLYLATFPIYSFWSLQLRLRIKIVLLCLLSMGLFAMIACIIKAVELRSTSEIGYPTVVQANLVHWAYIEAGLVVICSSVPCLRPLFVTMVENLGSSPRPTYELTPTYAQSGHTRSHITTRAHTYIRGDAHDDWGDGDSARQILEGIRGGITKETTVTVRNELLSA